jgi:hypothetical protein
MANEDNKPKYASNEQVANVLNITPRWLNRLVKEYGMPRIAHGEYDLVKCVHWYIDYLKKQIEEARAGGESLTDAKLRLTRKNADLREIELQEKLKELLPYKIVSDILFKGVQNFSKTSDSIGIRNAKLLFRAKSEKEIIKILNAESVRLRNTLISSLEELRKLLPANGAVPRQPGGASKESAGTIKTRSRNNRKPVGR